MRALLLSKSLYFLVINLSRKLVRSQEHLLGVNSKALTRQYSSEAFYCQQNKKCGSRTGSPLKSGNWGKVF